MTPRPAELDSARPYHSALELIRERMQLRLGGRDLLAIAHRVVHGGSKYFEAVRVDAAVLADLKSCIPLAPLHQPYALEVIESLLNSNPELPQVACFDTGFHHTIPMVEQILPLPWGIWKRGLRRFGFHGLSYEFQSIALAERFGELARGRTIVAHLGSGASLCAMQELRSVATTMGFSALDGLMMGTRTGALDPGVVLHLMEIEKLTLEQVTNLLYHESGLLGLSGISSEPHELQKHESDDSEAGERARIALQLYVRRIVREIGALTAVLGGLDMLVFTAGVGEHNAFIRERVCAALGWLGVTCDLEANNRHALVISRGNSRVRVVVEPANEGWIAATQALSCLGPGLTVP
jgi:acetate kinase